MDEKKSKKVKLEGRSLKPHKKRSESEMVPIISKINSGQLSIRKACILYGLNRNTLKLFMQKAAILSLGESSSKINLLNMSNEESIAVLKLQVKNLTDALEQSRVHIQTLDSMISIAEKELNISIRKKSGSKQYQK